MSSDESDSPEEIAEDIRDSFADEYSDYDLDKIAAKVEQFQSVNGIDDSEIPRAVTTSVMNDLGVDRDQLRGGSGGSGGGEATIEEVRDLDDDEWVDMTVKAVEAEDVPQSDAIGQGGVLGDETGAIDFVAWAKSDVDELDEGSVYNIESAVTGTYQGDRNLKLNSQTTIEEVDDDIDVDDEAVEALQGETTTEVVGCMVDLQSGSGLIKRCQQEDDSGDVCNTALRDGKCRDHGNVDGEHDLRLMAVVDDGRDVHEVVVGADLTEELTGITKSEAVDMAMDALDTDVVRDAMRERVLGRYYRVEGSEFGRYLNADDIEVVTDVEYDDDLLARAQEVAQ